MPTHQKLNADDRGFFSLVAEAAFSNPFSTQRDALDHEIAGGATAPTREALLAVASARVNRRLSRLEAAGRDDLRRYRVEEQRILRTAFLFDAFHRYVDRFDALILSQLAAGSTPCRVSFADETLGLLHKRGFPSETALTYFAVFYQLRRAFYFIDRALVGRSEAMRELRRHLWNSVFTSDIVWYDRWFRDRMEDFSTLLLGETGTGKGTAAAAVGRSGLIPFDLKRAQFACSFTDAFVSLNLSQFPEALLESELFGHRKGAFTGAVDHHEGVFARCSPHGAIFLDEIGDVGAPVQIKLLQVLQDRTFSPVGSHEPLRFEGRVMAATNKPIDELRRTGEFRDDFYYRLCSDIITVPPLRERVRQEPGELEDLLDVIIRRLTGQSAPELREHVLAALHQTLGPDYHWPGNVRELEQATRRILLTRAYDGDLPRVMVDLETQLAEGLRRGSLSAEDLLSGYCRLLHRRYGTYEEVARRAKIDRRTAKKYATAKR